MSYAEGGVCIHFFAGRGQYHERSVITWAWLKATYTAAARAWLRATLYIRASTETGVSAWTAVGSVAATGTLVPGRNVESLCGCLCGAHECDEDPACHS